MRIYFLKKNVFNTDNYNVIIFLTCVSLFLPYLIITPIFIGIIFLFSILKGGFKMNVILENKIILLFIVYFLLLVVSLFYTFNLSAGFRIIINHFSFLLLPLTILRNSAYKIDFTLLSKRYVNLLLLIFTLLLFFSLVRNFSEGYTLEYVIKRIGGLKKPVDKYPYFNYWYFVYDKFCEPLKLQPIYLGLFCNIGLAFLLSTKKSYEKLYFHLKLVVLLIFLTLIASRSQLLIGLFNYMFFTIYNLRKDRNRVNMVYALVIFFALGMISFFNPVIKIRMTEAFNFNHEFYEDSFGGTSLRLRKWKNSINAISSSPLFGYGVGDGKDELLKEYKRDKFYLGYYKKYNSHNQFLQTGLYVGILGILILLLIFYEMYGCKLANTNIYIFLVANIFFISFFTESILSRQWGIVSFPFFVSLAYLQYKKFNKI